MRKKLALGALCAFLFVTACKKEKSTVDQTLVTTSVNQGEFKKAYYRGSLITYQRINNTNVWAGDMLVPDDQLSATPPKKNDAHVEGHGQTNIWPSGTISYNISTSFNSTEKASILAAMTAWANKTGLKFVASTGTARLNIQRGTANNCTVGYYSGGTTMNLSDPNAVGIVVHELGHAIGMNHEQLRADRDKWITVQWSNISTEGQGGYSIFTGQDIEGTPFDYASIMLYGSYGGYGAIDGSKPTTTKKDGSTWIDQAWDGTKTPSLADIDWVKRQYGLSGAIVSGKTYILRSYLDNDKVFDLPASATTNGTPISLYGINGGNNQKFIFTYVDAGYYKISSALNSNKVLDVDGGSDSDGPQIQLWDWADVPHQKWQVQSVGGGYYKLIPANSTTRVITLWGGSTVDGTKIGLWNQSVSANDNSQKWKFEQVN